MVSFICYTVAINIEKLWLFSDVVWNDYPHLAWEISPNFWRTAEWRVEFSWVCFEIFNPFWCVSMPWNAFVSFKGSWDVTYSGNLRNGITTTGARSPFTWKVCLEYAACMWLYYLKTSRPFWSTWKCHSLTKPFHLSNPVCVDCQ